MGTGIKALKGQYAVYQELEKAGAADFEVLVRGEPTPGKAGEWVLCGYCRSEGDDAHGAVQTQLALILEHALVVHPPFKLMQKTLEAGWRPAAKTSGLGEDEKGGAPEASKNVEVALMERKAIPVGSLKAGFQNLVPIQVDAKKVAA